MTAELSKEMQPHTYAIMNRVEDSHWWFVGRRAILSSFLEELSEELKTERKEPKASETGERDAYALRILDVGCGTGANLEMLSKYGKSEGVDVSEEALTFCKSKGLIVKEGLAEELPYQDGDFDIVTGLDVIEHLDDDIAGLREMYRVLKPGGRLLVFVPAFMWLWGVQDDISHHRIRYKRKEIMERIERAGFVVERATYANLTFFLPILAGRLIMRLTGIKPESENNVNVSALNGLFGWLFGSERHFLRRFNFPFGVSVVAVGKKN